MSTDRDLKPYRVTWRASGSGHWTLIGEYDRHEEARDEARAAVKTYGKGGEARVIVQHVIERV